MISIDYFMSHGSPWTFLGHGRLGELIKKLNVILNIYTSILYTSDAADE